MYAAFLLYITMIATFFYVDAEQRKEKKTICLKAEDDNLGYRPSYLIHYPYHKESHHLPAVGAMKTTDLILLCGDALAEISDLVYDEAHPFDPLTVGQGTIILVGTHQLASYFSTIHPAIRARYILITHNSDDASPGVFEKHLEDRKIIAWLGQNATVADHPKFHPIPIGIANHQYGHGNVKAFLSVQNEPLSKKRLAYINFAVATFPTERMKVMRLLRNEPYCYVSPVKDFVSYLRDVRESYFVLSPRGNGLDCHRTWEALLMGAIPVVRTSCLDKLYEGLPVVIVREWDEVNEEFLQKKYEEMSAKNYSLEKLSIAYWREYIRNLLMAAGFAR